MKSILIEFHPWAGVGKARRQDLFYRAWVLGWMSVVWSEASIIARLRDLQDALKNLRGDRNG